MYYLTLAWSLPMANLKKLKSTLPMALVLAACGGGEQTTATDGATTLGTTTPMTMSDTDNETSGGMSMSDTSPSGGETQGMSDSETTTAGPTESDTDPTTMSETSESETGPNCVDDELPCGVECCSAEQVCFEGACAADCGGVPPCGPDRICCGDGDVCYLDECVTPGDSCTETLCATKDEQQQCADGFVCDPQLGLCVPSKADASCIYVPPQNVFDPVPLFTWGERDNVNCNDDSDCQNAETCMGGQCAYSWNHVEPVEATNNIQVSSIPVVVDLDDNCIPDVVFNTYRSGVIGSNGVIRAVRGDTGEPLWSVTDTMYESDGTANPAVGDIDSDGLPEVVVQGEGKYLIAIDSDGTPLWRSDNFARAENSGAAAIANMDGEGDPEIIFGAAVYDSAGTLLWEGSDGIGHQSQGPISCIADINVDGSPDLIGGNTAYTFTGTVQGGDFSGAPLWVANVGDGRCGVADFNLDGLPEVILVRGGNMYAINGQDGTIINTFDMPGGSDRGGAPNIADFNGDGQPDIGTAGSSRYVVVEFDGTDFSLLWQATVEDDSSRVTGSSVFDFDGDGRNEVVYNDEKYIRIYPGVEPDCQEDPPGPKCDGVMDDSEVLFRDYNSSRTRTEYPVIADVDGDFKAEIVYATNNDVSWGRDAGIEVLQDSLDNWVTTRPVWNQHSYHITNVGNLGQIPVVEENSWQWPIDDPFNSYRRNTQGSTSFCAPDLVPFDLQAALGSCPDLLLSARVANIGCLGVGPGVNVSFYEETLGLLGTVQTQNAIPAGASEQVELFIDTDVSDGLIWVKVDDDGMDMGKLNECVEDNNISEMQVACPMVG